MQYDPYRRRRWGRRAPRYNAGGGGNSCLRDACLIETGCCIGEALGDNCLISGFVLLPRLLGALMGTGGVVGAIRLYQREISAHRPAVCRFTPSCSQYAIEAVRAHGTWRGLGLAARRLLRCRAGGPRGID